MVGRMIVGLAMVIMLGIGCAQAQTFEARDYTALLGTPVFSEQLLKNHFKLYEGYVKNTNLLMEKLSVMAAEGKEKSPEYAELKRRLGWEYDGMLMHEYYFSNLGPPEALDPQSALYKKMVEDFGSFETWKKDFLATASIRGIGWAVLCQEPKSGRLINVWIDEHDRGHLAGGNVILVVDCFEHAFMLDYQTDRAAYLAAVWKAFYWKAAAQRLK